MSLTPDELIHGYLDETLAPDGLRALEQWIQADPEHARRFASICLLHDRLRTAALADVDISATPEPTVRTSSRRIGLPGVALTTTLCVLLGFGWMIWGPSQTTQAAYRELDRIIASVQQPVDRTYLVTVVEAGEHAVPPPARFRGGEQAPIDGAILHVRGPASFVLIRRYSDGSEFVTGGDGSRVWAAPPAGAVRISHDLRRFSGPAPGLQHAIPFIDLQDRLLELRENYEISLIEASSDPEAPAGTQRLEAVRTTPAMGGPKRVVVWYSTTTGRVQRMLLDRLPQAKGGPRSVLLDLTAERNLGADFFDHPAHHAPGREVIED